MSTEDYRIVDDPEAPAPRTEAPEPTPGPRTRTVRRPAAGRAGTRPRGRPKGAKTKASPPATTEATPADAIRGMLQIPAAGLIIAGQRVQSVPLVADGATILVHGPGVAKAIEEIAENDPRIMALLERVLAFGPYGVLLAALFPMVAQFGANHGGPLPILSGFGAVEPEQIISAAELSVPIEVSPNGQATPPPDGATATG